MKTPAHRPIPALKTLAALTLLAAIAALILYAALPAGASSHFTDYDTDDDGLIEIDTIAELQGIRLDTNGDGFIPAGNDRANYNAAFPNRQTVASRNSTSTRMGCPARCIGYELMADLDFATATTSLRNWTVGGNYSGILEGNGYTIANLSMNVTSGFTIGFISELSGVVRNLGLVNPSITTSGGRIGIVAGYNYGAINASWVSGGSVTYTQPEGVSIGGLVGVNDLIGAISASYSTASVNIATNIDGEGAVGGLVGVNNGRINASYAAGRVTGTTTATTTSPAFGGLVGDAVFEVVTENDLNQIVANSVITDSYCTAAGQAAVCIGDPASVDRPDIPTSTAAQLQTPTGYTGIYENWNVDVDGDTFPDNPWSFGTTSTYPTIRPLAQRIVDHDLDNDNLIDVDTLHKLNAIRHDLNGDGLPEAAGDYVAYAGVFPGGNFDISGGPRMGCATFCIGYELAAGLDFAADGVAVTSTDAYPNWAPIGGVAGYSGVFEGNGRAIARLTINRTGTDAGLFGRVAPRGVLRNVGMVDADIRGGGGGRGYAPLAGVNDGTIAASYAQGGTVALTGGNAQGGGLVGRGSSGAILAAYSTAAVDGGGHAGVNVGGLAGSIGSLAFGTGTIRASYAAGAVSGGGGGNSRIGGLVGQSVRAADVIANSYCDTTVNGSLSCVGAAVNSGLDAVAQTTAQLQTPTGYAGIYENWNIPLGAGDTRDDPWEFGGANDYPAIKPPAQRVPTAPPPPPTPEPPPEPTSTPEPAPTPEPTPEPGAGGNGGNGETATTTDTAPPALPRSIPPERERAYDPAADHPEIYQNAEYGMTTACQTGGANRGATLTFDLGRYDGPILLHLSLWRNGRYVAYETQGLASPTLERNGQRATVRVDTDPAQTRFRLDGRRYGLAANLLMGYADCRSDDS